MLLYNVEANAFPEIPVCWLGEGRSVRAVSWPPLLQSLQEHLRLYDFPADFPINWTEFVSFCIYLF